MRKNLERGEKLINLAHLRFIRIKESIYFDDSDNTHVLHKDLALSAGVTEQQDGKPIIDDGGVMKPDDGKLLFDDATNSCVIKGDEWEARLKTVEIAKKILGEDKVVSLN